MTRVSSFKLYQCLDCGQKHILPQYGSINLTHGVPGFTGIADTDLRVCQKCGAHRAFKEFPRIGTAQIPPRNNSSRTLRAIKKFLKIQYLEPTPYPTKLYPYLESEPFNPDTYYPDWIKAGLKEDDYPIWFEELSTIARNKNQT